MTNNNCDHSSGETSCSSNPEVRVLPYSDQGNIICCQNHYKEEIDFRIYRNKELSSDCQFELPEWSDLRVYSN